MSTSSVSIFDWWDYSTRGTAMLEGEYKLMSFFVATRQGFLPLASSLQPAEAIDTTDSAETMNQSRDVPFVMALAALLNLPKGESDLFSYEFASPTISIPGHRCCYGVSVKRDEVVESQPVLLLTRCPNPFAHEFPMRQQKALESRFLMGLFSFSGNVAGMAKLLSSLVAESVDKVPERGSLYEDLKGAVSCAVIGGDPTVLRWVLQQAASVIEGWGTSVGAQTDLASVPIQMPEYDKTVQELKDELLTTPASANSHSIFGKFYSGYVPLSIAVKRNWRRGMELLFSAGSPLDFPPNLGLKAPAIVAAQHENINVLRWLRENGCNIARAASLKYRGQRIPYDVLVIAVPTQNYPLVKFLVDECGCDPQGANPAYSPLRLTRQSVWGLDKDTQKAKQHIIYKFLLRRGAKEVQVDDSWRSVHLYHGWNMCNRDSLEEKALSDDENLDTRATDRHEGRLNKGRGFRRR